MGKGKGSGSVTTFSRADGFIVISRHQDYVAGGERVTVTPLGRDLEPANLVVIGSRCLGLDYLLGVMSQQSCRSKTLIVDLMQRRGASMTWPAFT